MTPPKCRRCHGVLLGEDSLVSRGVCSDRQDCRARTQSAFREFMAARQARDPFGDQYAEIVGPRETGEW